MQVNHALIGEGSGTLEFSAHNIFIETVTTIGLIGLLITGLLFASIWLHGAWIGSSA